MFKRAYTEHKRDETRLNNVIIHKAVEPKEASQEARQKNDQSLVKELLDHIGVEHKPVKVFRLGKYDEEQTNKSRPLKVVFDTSVAQDEIMGKVYKLAQAPDNIKNVSVNYDMNKDERDECSRLVKDAKNKSKNSTTHKYKVIGRPGQMKIMEIELKKK